MVDEFHKAKELPHYESIDSVGELKNLDANQPSTSGVKHQSPVKPTSSVGILVSNKQVYIYLHSYCLLIN